METSKLPNTKFKRMVIRMLYVVRTSRNLVRSPMELKRAWKP